MEQKFSIQRILRAIVKPHSDSEDHVALLFDAKVKGRHMGLGREAGKGGWAGPSRTWLSRQMKTI